jgi:hypothetical protein
MSNEHTLTLRQADNARADFALIGSNLKFIASQLAQRPTRGDLAKAALGIIFCSAVLTTCSSGSLGAKRTCHERRDNYRADDCARLCRPTVSQGVPIP